jgi:hypothetical protein
LLSNVISKIFRMLILIFLFVESFMVIFWATRIQSKRKLLLWIYQITLTQSPELWIKTRIFQLSIFRMSWRGILLALITVGIGKHSSLSKLRSFYCKCGRMRFSPGRAWKRGIDMVPHCDPFCNQLETNDHMFSALKFLKWFVQSWVLL